MSFFALVADNEFRAAVEVLADYDQVYAVSKCIRDSRGGYGVAENEKSIQ